MSPIFFTRRISEYYTPGHCFKSMGYRAVNKKGTASSLMGLKTSREKSYKQTYYYIRVLSALKKNKKDTVIQILDGWPIYESYGQNLTQYC